MSKGYQSYEPDIQIDLLIDKLTLLFYLPAQLSQGLPELLFGWLGDKALLAEFGVTRVYGAASPHYKISVVGRDPDASTENLGKAGFVLQAGPRRPSIPPVRLDINPACLNAKGLAYVRQALQVLNIEWTWVQQAHVTRADATLDIRGCSPDQFVWDIPKRRKRHSYWDEGLLRTLYLGSKHSSHTVIYDKAREQKLDLATRWTRVECRMLRLGPLQDLPQLACPYVNLLVFDPAEVKSIYAPLRAAMRTVGQAQGRSGVLSLFEAVRQPGLNKELERTTPGWWCPQDIWKQWHSVLSTSLYDLFDVPADAGGLDASYDKLAPDDKSYSQD